MSSTSEQLSFCKAKTRVETSTLAEFNDAPSK